MREQIYLEGRELVDHYLNDNFWELGDPEEWGVIEKPKDEEVFKLNLCELPSDTEEFCKDLAAHPQIEDVEQHRFGLNEDGVGDIIIDVITFHWLDPLDSEEDLRYGKYYKFDVWHGPATNYELIRWSDQPYSG